MKIAKINSIPKPKTPFYVTFDGVTQPADFNALSLNFEGFDPINNKLVFLVNAVKTKYEDNSRDADLTEIASIGVNALEFAISDDLRRKFELLNKGINSFNISPVYGNVQDFTEQLKKLNENLELSYIEYGSDFAIKGFKSACHYNLNDIIEFLVEYALKQLGLQRKNQ